MSEIYSSTCRVCHTHLDWIEIDDLWPHDENEIVEYHQELVEWMELVTDREWVEKNLEPKYPPEVQQVHLKICPVCRWWMIDKELLLITTGQLWELHYGAAGPPEVPLSNPSLPIARRDLAADYTRRFDMAPWLFERVVGSVFSSLGYHLRVTGCSHDGGIDIFMVGQDGELIGIQVKRLKKVVGIEQIRSFLGALILGNCKRGVFLTTSTYSISSRLAAEAAGQRGISIKLIDGPSFETLLKTAQIQDFRSEDDDPHKLAPLNQIPLEIIFENHMNSL